MITNIEDHVTLGRGRCGRHATPDCSARRWIDGLHAQRGICLDAGLSEHIKWAHPCFMFANRNICVMGAFRGDFRLSFKNAALMGDPGGVLERQVANTRHADCLRFKDVSHVVDCDAILRSNLAEAMGFAEAGIKPPKVETELDLSGALFDLLDVDPARNKPFHALTPGRQKTYVIQLRSAKQSATRTALIARLRGKTLASKEASERWLCR